MSAYELLLGHLKTGVEPTLLFETAMVLRDSIVRGDPMIGLLPLEAGGVVVEGLRCAGAGGVVDAWRELGRCYAVGIGVEADPAAALEAYRRAADAGSREGALEFVRHACWSLRDPALADEVGLRARALLDDDPDGRAHALCGHLALLGYGLPGDPSESARLHSVAAERGDRDAMFELYVLLSTGQGVEQDEVTALKWCKKAAESGQARAAYNLGAFYATGRGVPRDPAESVKWYERASAARHGRASATLGYMFLVGEGVERDGERARDLFEAAEEQGFEVDDFLESLGVSRPEH